MSKKPPAARVTIQRGTCTLLCSSWMTCPLCGHDVPPNTVHECEKDGAITVVRQRPSTNLIEDAVEAIASSRR